MITEKKNKRIDGSFIRVQAVRNIDGELNKLLKQKVIYTNINEMSLEEYLKELSKFEKKYSKRDYQKKKARYGYIIHFLVPSCSESKKRRLAYSISKELIGDEKGLKTICVIKKRVIAEYLIVFVSDREYYKQSMIKRYDKDLIKNKITKRWTKASDPDGVIVHKKGEAMVDQNGAVKKETILFKKRKSRRFNYKRNEAEYFDKLLIDILAAALNKEDLSYAGFSFPRLNLKEGKNKFLKRIIVRSNITMVMIEGLMIQTLGRNIEYKDHRSKAKHELDPDAWWWEKKVDKNLYAAVKSFYYKYLNRFKKGSYHDENEIIRSIAKTRCDVAEENLNHLFDMAQKELEEIENNYLIKKECKNDER